jgi:hypothetical protein
MDAGRALNGSALELHIEMQIEVADTDAIRPRIRVDVHGFMIEFKRPILLVSELGV